MTCSHCGANLMDETVCPYCRCRVEFPKQNAPDLQNSRNFQEIPPDSEKIQNFQNYQNYPDYSANFSGKSSELPVKARPMPPAGMQHLHPDQIRYKKPALLMCALGFIGIGGLQRFYTGKIFSGLLYLFTFGLFGIGTLIDLILILMNYFHDRNGNQLQ